MENEQQAWETADGWAERVSRPVIDHNMAPRHARAILEAAGALLDVGVPVDDVLAKLDELRR